MKAVYNMTKQWFLNICKIFCVFIPLIPELLIPATFGPSIQGLLKGLIVTGDKKFRD
jgi:hypothetical protein